MSKEKTFISLPRFLKKFAAGQYESGLVVVTRKKEATSSCFDIVQYLLWSYTHSKHITNAILQLKESKKQKRDIEQEFAYRLHDGVGRCSHVNDPDEVVSLLVEGLNSEIRSLLQSYRDYNWRTSYL